MYFPQVQASKNAQRPVTQNLQHQQTLQKSGCERPCGDHRHLMTVPSNHQREEKARKHKTSCGFNVLCLDSKLVGWPREELLPLRPPGPANGSSDSSLRCPLAQLPSDAGGPRTMSENLPSMRPPNTSWQKLSALASHLTLDKGKRH